MNFLLGKKVPEGMLDAATLREMRMSAMLQQDGSAIGGATYEAGMMQGRWSFNKLGCEDGYRSSITLVPSLGLGVFAAVASTCDNYGDGDALGFPIASSLIRPVAAALRSQPYRTSSNLHSPSASMVMVPASEYTGVYCEAGPTGTTVSWGPARELVMLNGLDGDVRLGQGLPFVLHEVTGTKDLYRMVMGNSTQAVSLPQKWAGCHSDAWPSANLCPLSCFRRMVRGDLSLLRFQRDLHGTVSSFVVEGAGYECKKVRG